MKSQSVDVGFMFVDDMCQAKTFVFDGVSDLAPNDINVPNVVTMQSGYTFSFLLLPKKFDGLFRFSYELGVDGPKRTLL